MHLQHVCSFFSIFFLSKHLSFISLKLLFSLSFISTFFFITFITVVWIRAKYKGCYENKLRQAQKGQERLISGATLWCLSYSINITTLTAHFEWSSCNSVFQLYWQYNSSWSFFLHKLVYLKYCITFWGSKYNFFLYKVWSRVLSNMYVL